MKNSNQRTLQTYEANIEKFVSRTPHDVSSANQVWFQDVLSDIPKSARILEIGSAFGKEACFIKSLGYQVQCTDAAQGFLDILETKGLTPRKLDVLTDEIPGPHDLIIAKAVLVHFTRDETALVLKKIFDALAPNGTLACTTKQGDGEEWSDSKLDGPRYFCYWQKDQLSPLLSEAGFADIHIETDKATRNAKWLYVVAKKNAE